MRAKGVMPMAFELLALIVGFAASLITIGMFIVTVIKHFVKKKSALSGHRTDNPVK